MGCLCITAAPDLHAKLRLTGCCIPVVKELQRQRAGQKHPVPIHRQSGGGELSGGDVVSAIGCSQHSPCLQALPLLGFHFRKVGRKPELTLMWEPEELEQEPVPQVRHPSTRWALKTMRLCATHGSHELCRDWSGGRTALQALWSCCPLCPPPQRAPAQPQPPGPSSPTLSHHYSASDPSTAFGLCPTSQFNFLQELTCCLLPSSTSSVKMLRKFKPKAGSV